MLVHSANERDRTSSPVAFSSAWRSEAPRRRSSARQSFRRRCSVLRTGSGALGPMALAKEKEEVMANRLFDTDAGVLTCAARARFSVAGQRRR